MKTINKRIALVVAVVMVFTAFFSLLMFSMLTNAEEYALKGVNAHLFENGILVNAGEILIDGVNIKNIPLISLRSLMGNVNQEAILFNDTFYNNIPMTTFPVSQFLII